MSNNFQRSTVNRSCYHTIYSYRVTVIVLYFLAKKSIKFEHREVCFNTSCIRIQNPVFLALVNQSGGRS